MSSQPSHSLLPFLPYLSFHAVIEADHKHISSLASQFLQHLYPSKRPENDHAILKSKSNLNPDSDPDLKATLSALLSRIITHLIRHDMSEDLVMRPAFEKYLPTNEEGMHMANHDRQDHQELKARMLDVAKLVDEMDGSTKTRDDILMTVRSLFRDMKRHMDEESGEQLIRFRDVVRSHQTRAQDFDFTSNSNINTSIKIGERTISDDIEMILGKQYILTLVLTPDVEICTHTHTDVHASSRQYNNSIDSSIIDSTTRMKCFPGGVQQYISAPSSRFREIMTILLEDASTGRDKGYLLHKIKEELNVLGLGTKSSEMKL